MKAPLEVKMKILVFGENSQVGKELYNLIFNSSYDYKFTNSKEMNFLDKDSIKKNILQIKL